MVRILLVCFFQSFVEVAVGRSRDAFRVSFFEGLVVGKGVSDRRWEGLDGLTRERVERNDTENIVPLQGDTVLFLAGFVDDDDAPVIRADVDRSVDTAATGREIPDASRETCDASSQSGQELPPLYCQT